MKRNVDLSPRMCELVSRYATHIIRNKDDFVGAEVKAAEDLRKRVSNAEDTVTIGKLD